MQIPSRRAHGHDHLGRGQPAAARGTRILHHSGELAGPRSANSGSRRKCALSPELIVLEDNTGGSERRVEDLLVTAGYRKDFVWTHNVFYVKASGPRHVRW